MFHWYTLYIRLDRIVQEFKSIFLSMVYLSRFTFILSVNTLADMGCDGYDEIHFN